MNDKKIIFNLINHNNNNEDDKLAQSFLIEYKNQKIRIILITKMKN